MVTNIALLTGFFVLRANAADFARAAGKKEAEISEWVPVSNV